MKTSKLTHGGEANASSTSRLLARLAPSVFNCTVLPVPHLSRVTTPSHPRACLLLPASALRPGSRRRSSRQTASQRTETAAHDGTTVHA